MPDSQLPYSTSPLLEELDCIRYGFFGAQGGVSSGIYTSLNCGYSSSDDPDAIRLNRQRVAAHFALDVAQLYSLRQAHTTRVIEIDRNSAPQFETCADGMVSREAGVALSALGADCAPVLFVDPVARVIGAAHSGWKGALEGINEAVLDAMAELGAQRTRIRAAIGPAMQQAHYQVQADFRTNFEQHSPIDPTPFFLSKETKTYFDTPGYVRARLCAAGITQIDLSNEDTYSQPARYFSYRRSCHNNAPDYGRQIAAISLNRCT